MFSRSHRVAYRRSRVPRRYVPWSQKVFYLEQSKKKIQSGAKWHEWIFLGIKEESEVAMVGTPHRTAFVNSINGGSMGLSAWSRQRDREQNAVGCQSCRFRSTGTAGNRGAVAKKSLHQATSGIGDVRVHGPVYRVPACEIEIGAGGPQ